MQKFFGARRFVSAALMVFIGVAIAAVLFSPFMPARGAAYVWDGGGTDGTCGGNPGDGNKWSCAANWSADIVPTSADTVTFNSTSLKDATVDSAFAGTISGMTIGNSYTGTITLARSFTVSGTFLQNGATFTAGSQALTLNVFTLSAGIFNASSGTTNINGALTISGSPTFNANGGTVAFGTGTAILACNNVTFNLVVFTNTAGSKSVGTGCTLPLGSNASASGGGAINVNSGGTLTGTGTFTTTGTLNLNGGTFSGLSGLSMAGLTASSTAPYDFSAYTAFTVSGTATLATSTITLPTGGATLTGAVTLNSASILTASTATTTLGATFTMNSGSTFNGNGGVLVLPSTVTINTGSTFNAQSGTVNFGGAGGGAVNCGPAVFSKVTITNAGGTKAFNTGCTLPLGNNPTILSGAGSVSLNTGSSLTGSGTLTTAGTGSFNLSGGTLVGFNGLSAQRMTTSATYDFSSFSPFTIGSMTLNSGSVVTLPTAGVTFSTGLTIGTGATLTGSTATTTVAGVFRLGSGATYNSNNGILAIPGTFRNDGGTFNAGTGTVSLTGTNQSIIGSTTFYNLIKIVSTTDTLTFASSTTQTIQGSLILRGGDGSNLLSLASDALGVPWLINPQGTVDARLVNVSDSTNNGPTIPAYVSRDGGNNTAWSFPAPTVPGTPTASTPTTNTTPTFTWTASTNNSFGIDHYEIGWSQDASFASGVSSSTATVESCQISTVNCGDSSSLATATWYVRVRALDAVGNASAFSPNGSVVIQAPSGGGGGGGSGGGGGGGGSIIIAPAALPVDGTRPDLAFTLNGGNPITNSPTITLSMNADPSTVRSYFISTNSAFPENTFNPYVSDTTFTLPSVPATYTVYLKYYSISGMWSNILSRVITYVLPSTGSGSGGGTLPPAFPSSVTSFQPGAPSGTPGFAATSGSVGTSTNQSGGNINGFVNGVLATSSNPAQLFDIRLLVGNPTVSSITQLSAQVTFDSFGSVPTPVAMHFDILDASGNSVWSGDEQTTVETSAVFTKEFSDANALPDAKYTLRLQTLYNGNVQDTFEQPFEIHSRKALLGTLGWVKWWLLGLAGILGVLLFGFFILFKKSCCECDTNDKECYKKCRDRKFYLRTTIVFVVSLLVSTLATIVAARMIIGEWGAVTFESGMPEILIFSTCAVTIWFMSRYTLKGISSRAIIAGFSILLLDAAFKVFVRISTTLVPNAPIRGWTFMEGVVEFIAILLILIGLHLFLRKKQKV